MPTTDWLLDDNAKEDKDKDKEDEHEHENNLIEQSILTCYANVSWGKRLYFFVLVAIVKGHCTSSSSCVHYHMTIVILGATL